MTIHLGDCIEVMRGMPADSVDAVVTDPPYGLEFMGKGWDKFGRDTGPGYQEKPRMNDGAGLGGYQTRPNFYTAGTPFQAWCEAWGTEALRVTKPGGYLLAFGGTRTHHRLVCGLEDAGWIIRDELDWIYASGFPKGKANLKPAHEPIVLARKPGPLRSLGIEENRIATTPEERDWMKATARPNQETSDWGSNQGTSMRAPAGFDPPTAGRWPSNLLLSSPELFDEPNPYVVGSGATALSGWRNEDRPNGALGIADSFGAADVTGPHYGDIGGYSRFFIVPKSSRADREPVVRGQLEQRGQSSAEFGGEAGRPGRSLRDGEWVNTETPRKTRANAHPTVKPVDLMRHLIRLVTPSGGTVLDPFLGSGSTAIAAELEGFPWIGIEKEPEYVAIAEARLNGVQRGLGLDVAAPTKKRELPSDEKLAELGRTYKNHKATSIWQRPDEEPAA